MERDRCQPAEKAVTGSTRRRRQRGEIEALSSGSLRIRVYAGIDPISGKQHCLSEVIPAGKDAGNLAERARARIQGEVDERRNPRTKATAAQLMERYLEVLQIEDTTRNGYERLVLRTSARCSDVCKPAGSTARPLIRSTRSSAAVGSTARTAGPSTIEQRTSRSTTGVANRTSAIR